MCENVISDKKKRVRSRACALTRRTNDNYMLERTTRLARSRSPIDRKFEPKTRLGGLAPLAQLRKPCPNTVAYTANYLFFFFFFFFFLIKTME